MTPSRIVPQPPTRPIIEPRRILSRKERAELLLAFNGRCAICGHKITDRTWIADHDQPLGFEGSNDITNFRPLHVACDKPKTAADLSRMAKADRVRAKHETPRAAWPGGRAIRSRGFQKRQWGNE